MTDNPQDFLPALSAALTSRVAAARDRVAAIAVRGHPLRSGTLWRRGVVVASEQALPDSEAAEITFADSATIAARIAGRDAGTNIAVLRFDGGPDAATGQAEAPRPGALVLALGADGEGGVSARLGAVHSVGSAWHSRAGGHIARRILLDITLSGREEGGPVVDAAGGVIGISTLGPRRRVLVIPSATVERVLEPLLTKGRVERGWLGAAVQPVLVPEPLQAEAGQTLGLMAIGVTPKGPAAEAGVLAGDILLGVAGTALGSSSQLARILDETAIGTTVPLRLIRAGELRTLDAVVGTRPPR